MPGKHFTTELCPQNQWFSFESYFQFLFCSGSVVSTKSKARFWARGLGRGFWAWEIALSQETAAPYRSQKESPWSASLAGSPLCLLRVPHTRAGPGRGHPRPARPCPARPSLFRPGARPASAPRAYLRPGAAVAQSALPARCGRDPRPEIRNPSPETEVSTAWPSPARGGWEVRSAARRGPTVALPGDARSRTSQAPRPRWRRAARHGDGGEPTGLPRRDPGPQVTADPARPAAGDPGWPGSRPAVATPPGLHGRRALGTPRGEVRRGRGSKPGRAGSPGLPGTPLGRSAQSRCAAGPGPAPRTSGTARGLVTARAF